MMWIRLVSAKFHTDKIEEAVRIYYEDVVPAIQTQPGLMGVFLLEPKEVGDDYISLSAWRSKADWEAYEAGPYGTQLSKMQHVIATTPKVQAGEVAEIPAIFEEKIGEKVPWVRLVLQQVKPEKIEELRTIFYETFAQPPFPPGMIDLFLMESPEEPGSFISCSLWNSLEESEEYHTGGLFAENVKKVQHLLEGSTVAKFYQVTK